MLNSALFFGCPGVSGIKNRTPLWALQTISTLWNLYLKGKNNVLDLFTGRRLDVLFKFRQLICTAHIAAHIILPPVSTKLFLATLTLGVFKKKSGRWYPDVNVCLCLDSSKESLYICVLVCVSFVYTHWLWTASVRADFVAWSRKIWAL